MRTTEQQTGSVLSGKPAGKSIVRKTLYLSLTHGMVIALRCRMVAGTRQEEQMREIYASSNGDRWDLIVNASTGHTFVRHTANEPSGGHVVDMALPIFLSLDCGGPEHQALWGLIRTLVA